MVLYLFCQVPKLNKELFSPSTYRKELFQNKDNNQTEEIANKENIGDEPNKGRETRPDEPIGNKISLQETVGTTTSIPNEDPVATAETQFDKITTIEHHIKQEPIVNKE